MVSAKEKCGDNCVKEKGKPIPYMMDHQQQGPPHHIPPFPGRAMNGPPHHAPPLRRMPLHGGGDMRPPQHAAGFGRPQEPIYGGFNRGTCFIYA